MEHDSDSDQPDISKIEPTKAEEEALARGLQVYACRRHLLHFFVLLLLPLPLFDQYRTIVVVIMGATFSFHTSVFPLCTADNKK